MDSPARRALTGDQADLLRQIPSVDELLAQPRLAALAQRVDRELLVEITRTVLADLRGRITGEGTAAVMALDSSVLEERIASMVEQVLASSLEPVINATGVILHTNLGRAPLIIAAAEEVRRSATSYSNLEYDLEAGARGKRDVHIAQSLERLTGAEAAIVVNNCAAAVLLVLAALAKGGEVIREVGTTNRTRIADYENAINENTRLLLRVHPSNFTITGFAEKPSLEELVALGQRVGLPLVEDLGSGCLVELSESGISEPTVRQSVDAGVSIVMFSGDKLLGGPQAGIIGGKRELVSRVRRHPLFRALRPELPLDEVEVEIVDGTSLAGGGSTPTQSLPTKLIRIASARYSAAKLEERLRRPPAGISVIARVEEDRLVLDLRTVFPEQKPLLAKTLAAALH